MNRDNEVAILSAVRTPIGKFMGSLSGIPGAQLGATVIRAALQRAGVAPDQVNEVVLGSVLTAGSGQNTARQAALLAGIPVNVPAYTLNMVCGSGLMSIIHAARAILTGEAQVVVASGTENMSAAPFLLPRAREGFKMGHVQLLDSMIHDGLTDAFEDLHMGVIAEGIAQKVGISRIEQDRFAQRSQEKARAAIQASRFTTEVVPVEVRSARETRWFEQDEFPRFDSTIEGLAKLKPAFLPNGTITAGNASGISDGAAALVVVRRGFAEALGIQPLAMVRSWGIAGVEPSWMGLGPVPASRKALERATLSMADIQLVESNEAFAAQTLAVAQELEIPLEKLNVNGGAIALGHPIGASGARITVTLIHEMLKRGCSLGLATLCIGGGMGAALILENAGGVQTPSS